MEFPYAMYCGVCEAITEHTRGTCKLCLEAFKAREMERTKEEIREAEGLDDRCYNADEQ